MEIRRGGKQPHEQFAMVPNLTARDATLSFRARGILTFLLSHRDGWKVTTERVAEEGREGRDSVRKAFIELEHAGYLRRSKVRNPDGTLAHVVTLYPYGDAPAVDGDAPEIPDVDQPESDASPSGSPAPDNQALVNQAPFRRPSKNTISNSPLRDDHLQEQVPESPLVSDARETQPTDEDSPLRADHHRMMKDIDVDDGVSSWVPSVQRRLLVNRYGVTNGQPWEDAFKTAALAYAASHVEGDLPPHEHLSYYLVGCSEGGHSPSAQRWLRWYTEDRAKHLKELALREEMAKRSEETPQEREDRMNKALPPLDWGLPSEEREDTK